MLGLIHRTACDVDEAFLILDTPAANAFSDIRTNTVCRANHLFSDGIPSKLVPCIHDVPKSVSQFLREIIDSKVLKISGSHNFFLNVKSWGQSGQTHQGSTINDRPSTINLNAIILNNRIRENVSRDFLR